MMGLKNPRISKLEPSEDFLIYTYILSWDFKKNCSEKCSAELCEEMVSDQN